jgi:hypothetical protein
MQHVNFEAVSNREDWVDTFEVREDDVLVDLTAATILFQLRDKTSKRTVLHATVGSGVTLGDPGQFTILFPVEQMRQLNASVAYEVGCTIKRGSRTQQYFTGTLPVLDGVVEP